MSVDRLLGEGRLERVEPDVVSARAVAHFEREEVEAALDDAADLVAAVEAALS